MKLTGISWQGYSLPFRRKYLTPGNQAMSRCGLLLFLKTDSGLVGVGEASPPGSGSLDEVRKITAILEGSTSRLLGEDSEVVEETLSAWEIPASLRFGIETALLDLKGQNRGVPVTVLLGGKPSTLAVNALITAESPEQVELDARKAVGLGFTNLKLKVGRRTLSEDEHLVSTVRRVVGPQVKLRLDPNQAWNVNQAIESIRQLSRYQLEFVEQPVPAVDITGLAKVRRSVPVAVAADESLSSLDDLHRLLDAGAADIFIIKASRLGGLRAALEVATEVIKARQSVVVTTSLESGVGISASTHLATALPTQSYAQGLATGLLFTQDLVYPALAPTNGMFMTPDEPGLGVRVDTMLLREYGTAIMGSASSLSRLHE